MSRALPVLLFALILAACGDDPAPVTTPPTEPPSPEVVENPGPFGLETRVGIPGRPPPIRVTGDARGVVYSVERMDEDLQPDPDRLDAGLYTVTAVRGDTVVRALLVVADLGLVIKRSPTEILVFVADAASGEPVSGADVEMASAGAPRKGRTDADGVLRVDLEPTSDVTVIVRKGERFGYGESDAVKSARLVTCLLPDRPVGRIGERVRVAGFYRARNGDYRSASAREVLLEIVDAMGYVLDSAPAARRSPGSFDGEVEIPAGAPSAGLRLRAVLDGDATSIPMPVEGVPSSGFAVRVEVVKSIGRTGVEFPFRIAASDVTGAPLTGAAIRYRVDRIDGEGAVAVLMGSAVVLPRKVLAAGFTPERPGRHRISATVTDRNGLTESGARTVEVRSPPAAAPDVPEDEFRLTADRRTAEPGQTVTLTLKLPFLFTGTGVLLTSEGGGLGAHSVETTTEPEARIGFETPDTPGRWVRFVATAVKDRRRLRSEARVWIRPNARRLSVEVRAEREAVEIRLAGPDGRPVGGRASVVAVEDVGPVPRIEEAFYDGAPFGVATRMPLMRVRRARSDGAPMPADDVAAESPGEAPRDRAPDTALWRPDVRIEDGVARVPFRPPFRPTDWRILVFAESEGHRFGTGIARIPSPVPGFGLAVPSFLVSGDLVTVLTTGAPARIRSSGLLVVERRPGAATLSADLPLPAMITAEDPKDPRISATREIDVRPALALRRTTVAGRIDGGLLTEYVALPDPKSARMTILLGRGAATAVGHRPGFRNDTTDGALANCLPEGPGTRVALALIYARQAPDGSFAPWEGARPDLVTTARVASVLGRLRAANFPVDEARLEAAAVRLESALSNEIPDPAVRAVLLDALTDAGRDVGAEVDRLFPAETRDRLSPAVAARLLRVLTVAKRRTDAAPLLTLLAKAEMTDVETTAVVLRGLLSEPGGEVDDLVDAMTRFLLDRRDWRRPGASMEAAAALLAAAERRTATPGPAVPLRIRVNDALVKAITIDPTAIAAEGRRIEVPGKVLAAGRNVIRIETAPGADLDFLVRLEWRERPAAGASGTSVRREVATVRRDGEALRIDPVKGAVRRGDVLLMTAVVEADGNRRIVDLPLPGGTVLLGPKTSLDDALPRLPKGTGVVRGRDRTRFLLPESAEGEIRLGVLVRVTHAGRFTLRPVTISAIDGGEPLGSSDPGILYVE
jgi:hypothetical protein